ncbi:MAG: Crp/Fnr family transcriptional regulator [Pseudomonadota bacterium]
MSQSWIDQFEGLNQLEGEWRDTISRKSKVVSIPPETVVFAPGKPADNMIFLLDGTVRVQQVSENGREIVLYRIEAGESCIMTASCIIGDQHYSAEGVAETVIEAAIIPKPVFEELLGSSSRFRNFIFSTVSSRLAELMHIINEIAFRRVDIRLAQKLVSLAKGSDEIMVTHQQLATELGTAREVVSRQLQEFQRREWISQSRGTIRILKLRPLTELSLD